MKNKLQKVIFVCALALFGLSNNANAQALQWAKAMGGNGNARGNSIAIDGSGNVYTIGTFETISDFDPGAGVFNLTSQNYEDIFISKLDASGNFVWAKAMGGVNSDYGYSIALDGSGNVYTTGSFNSIVDFDPGAGVANLNASGGFDIFISKLDASGNFVWANAMGVGGTSWDVSFCIALDVSGNVYTTGIFSDIVDFDPGAGVTNLTSAGLNDIFISKLDASGNFVWAKAIGGADTDYGYSIALDGSGNVYTTGIFGGTVDFDPGAGIANLTSVGSYDIFISKLNASGNFVWAKAMGGSGGEESYSIALDGSGNVYATGVFSDTADFDPGAGIANLTSVGGNDIFISKLDSSGNFVWAKAMGGMSYDYGNSIALDASGNVYTTGNFEGTSDFDPAAGVANLTSAGINDIFISKLDTSGNFVWANAMGGINIDYGYSIALDGSGNVYTTGFFQFTADFDPGSGVANLTGWGNNVFVAKYFQTAIGINNNEYSKDLFSIYPNPSTGKFSIEFSNQHQITSVEIYNLLGESVFQQQNTNEIDLSSAAKGIYFVKVYAGEKIYTEKIIVE